MIFAVYRIYTCSLKFYDLYLLLGRRFEAIKKLNWDLYYLKTFLLLFRKLKIYEAAKIEKLFPVSCLTSLK